MRTTIEIPDVLFREIKAHAVLRGETLKTFMLRAAKTELEAKPAPARERVKLPLVQSKENSYDIRPERFAEIQEEEDLEILAGH